jgi:hypothetical protein
MSGLCKRFAFGALAILLLTVAGCAQPIRNVSNAPIAASTSARSLESVGNAIKQAGAGLGWIMKQQEPGKIIGTLNLRAHQAVVDITYDTSTYSINYADSSNLKYDQKSGTIHKNYNGWIENLNRAIKTNLANI